MAVLGPKIVVIGSINMDLVVRCQKLPTPGETLIADSSSEICGGKGANQAVAAARAGGRVAMVGRVGDDAFADRLIGNLEDSDIDTTHVLKSKDCASGLAVVAVEQTGQNSIMVVPGANAEVTVADVERVRTVIESSSVLLLQLEVPLETVIAAINIANSAGVRVVMDPAPAPSTWPDELLNVDVLCPNETEASHFVGEAIENVAQAIEAARTIHSRGAKSVAVTMGDQGTLLFDGESSELIPPFAVDAVDSTAAGDAFAGALAVYWAEHHNLREAARFGNAAGALAASRHGAQPSMASRKEIDDLYAL